MKHAFLHHGLGVFLAVLALAATAAQAAPVGEVVLARGAATAQNGSAPARLLGKAAPLELGDVVTTGRKSFVIMKMSDGTRMTLRPETVFKVEQWNTAEKEENAALRLFKGGLRAVSGFIAKRSPTAFRLNTSVATIGIRGTTFDARLCDAACRAEAAQYETVAASVSKVVGRVGFVKGTVTARRPQAGVSRALSSGAPLYEGDAVVTASKAFAVLLFKDRSRITLRADSEFQIEALDFADEDTQSAAFRLLRGGLRAVSGLIAKRFPERVKFHTAIATIGIRGTGFDLICQEACAGDARVGQADGGSALERLGDLLIPRAVARETGPGLYAAPWDGVIALELPAGDIMVQEGQIVFLAQGATAPVFLPALPIRVPEPRPESIDIDEETLLGAAAQDEPDEGLYLACHEGYCLLGDTPLGEGETAFSSGAGDEPIRLELIPRFLDDDPYFGTVNVDPAVLDVGIENPVLPGGEECVVE